MDHSASFKMAPPDIYHMRLPINLLLNRPKYSSILNNLAPRYLTLKNIVALKSWLVR